MNRRVVAAVVVAVVGVVPVVVALHDSGGPALPRETRPYPMVAAASPTVPSDRVQLYLLAMRNPLAGPELVDRPGGAVIAMRECAGASRRPVVECRGAVIPADVRAAVTTRTGARFVTRLPWPRSHDPISVGFGTLRITGDHATLEIESMCDALCGRGARLSFVRHDRVWRADRHAGWSGWLS